LQFITPKKGSVSQQNPPCEEEELLLDEVNVQHPQNPILFRHDVPAGHPPGHVHAEEVENDDTDVRELDDGVDMERMAPMKLDN